MFLPPRMPQHLMLLLCVVSSQAIHGHMDDGDVHHTAGEGPTVHNVQPRIASRHNCTAHWRAALEYSPEACRALQSSMYMAVAQQLLLHYKYNCGGQGTGGGGALRVKQRQSDDTTFVIFDAFRTHRPSRLRVRPSC